MKTLLIANRGEVALRILQAAREMGLRVALLASSADLKSTAACLADTVVHLPGESLSQTYLDQEKVLHAVSQTKADLLHPGFGFLSENADFARKVKGHSSPCVWVGPPPESMDLLSSKVRAKEKAKSLNIPILPWMSVDELNEKTVGLITNTIGYPALVKASAGGGGKGLKRIDSAKDAIGILASSQREALEAFGDGRLFVEKMVSQPRHIEIQAFGLQNGDILTFGERDCSIQRRFQKIIEESPSPGIDRKVIAQMERWAQTLLKTCGYKSAGTVEFLYDTKNSCAYFMEVNTRLQVEHPVTEERYGIDLVRMQLQLALGLDVKVPQDPRPRGHCMELRLYAEDPWMHFLPQPGTIEDLFFPTVKGFRLESALKSGDAITGQYDPMIAKLIFFDDDRDRVLEKAKNVLRQIRLLGPTTNRDFLLQILSHPRFIAGNSFDTGFLQDEGSALQTQSNDFHMMKCIAAGLIKEVIAEKSFQKVAHSPGPTDSDLFSSLGFRRGL